MGVKKAVGSFIMGLIMTLVLLVLVPILMDRYIVGYIEELIGDNRFLFLTSDILVMILTYAVIIGFMVLLGAGGVLRSFGIFGILGLIVAYWALGDVTDAFLPLLILCAMLLVSWARTRSKEKKKAMESAKDY